MTETWVYVSCSSSGIWRKSLSCRRIREVRSSSFIHGSDSPCLLVWDSCTQYLLAAAAAEPLNTSSKQASFLIRQCNSSNLTVPAAQVRLSAWLCRLHCSFYFSLQYKWNQSLSLETCSSMSGSPAKSSALGNSSVASSMATLQSPVSEPLHPVQTQQPCSLKVSLSSDNICNSAPHTLPGQGNAHTCVQISPFISPYCVCV